MSLVISALRPPNSSLKLTHSINHLHSINQNRIILFGSSSESIKTMYSHRLSCVSPKFPRFQLSDRTVFFALSKNGGESGIVDEAEEEARGQSTMPDRFRPLTKEAPERPVRWPWFVALAFILYAWRTVLWELSNWKKVVVNLIRFAGYLSKLALALIFYFIGDTLFYLIRAFETTLYTIRAFYSSVIAYAPVGELIMIIGLVSTVLAVAKASVPDSVENEPHLLTVAGIIGYAAVRGFITEVGFWVLLFGLFGFARFVKKRDYVSSALPVAAVLAGVGNPWVRFVVVMSFLALAITNHSKLPRKDEGEAADIGRKVPVALLLMGLAVGVRVAAKWAGYRHLTWMVV